MLNILRRPHSQDYEAMIYDASVHGLKMIVKDYRGSPAHFPERFFELIKDMQRNWSKEEPRVQVWGAGAKRSFALAPLANDEHTLEVATDHIIHILPHLIKGIGVTQSCFAIIAERPDRTDALLVGGAGENGECILGCMEITLDSRGYEFLGDWIPVDSPDHEYFELISSWLVETLCRRNLLCRLYASMRQVVGWVG